MTPDQVRTISTMPAGILPIELKALDPPEPIIPRLTIGIPTHRRPATLPRAVLSCLRQTVPVRVLVSHDGDDMRTEEILYERFPDEMAREQVVYRCSGTKGLWANWDAAARACDTEFFCWLQDDDVIMESLAARVIAAFDQFPEADTYMAPNKLALDDSHIWWNNGNGPWVPMHRLGIVDQWECEVLAPTCYFVSWSLSPGVAFRCGPRFTAALDAMPMDCDIFAERLILVGMGGRFVADPAVAGLWIQHGDNEHRKLYDDQPRQSRILIEHLDAAMDGIPNWAEVLDLWARLQHPNWILGWLGEFEHVQKEGGASRYGDAICRVLARSLKGRVKLRPIPLRWWQKPIHWLRRRAAL
jgi:glycosyltransferase involved in cell wall biosynthesis